MATDAPRGTKVKGFLKHADSYRQKKKTFYSTAEEFRIIIEHWEYPTSTRIHGTWSFEFTERGIKDFS